MLSRGKGDSDMEKIFTCEINDRGLETVECIAISELGNVYVGRAVCAPQDEFSLQDGMRIAEIRATIEQLDLILENRYTEKDLLLIKTRQTNHAIAKIHDKIDQLELELTELTE